MARYTMAVKMTLDGTTFPGNEIEIDIPTDTEAQSQGPVVLSYTVAEWGFPSLTEAELEAATFGFTFYRGPSSTDSYGRVNDILNARTWYEGDTVGTPPITAMTQQTYLPGCSVRGGPAGLRRG